MQDAVAEMTLDSKVRDIARKGFKFKFINYSCLYNLGHLDNPELSSIVFQINLFKWPNISSCLDI